MAKFKTDENYKNFEDFEDFERNIMLDLEKIQNKIEVDKSLKEREYHKKDDKETKDTKNK